MGNVCCAQESNKEYEHIAGQTIKTTPNPGIGELETDALKTVISPANVEKINQNGFDDQ